MERRKFIITVKQRIILGLVGLFFTFAIAYIKGCFNKTEAKKMPVVNSHISNYQSSIGQQYNAGRDIVFSSPTSKVDTNTTNPLLTKVHTGQKNQRKFNSTKKDTLIVNNGFINNGGVGNTYNQTMNPPSEQRHLSPLDKIYLDTAFSPNLKFFLLDVYNFDKESLNLSNEISNYLESKNYTPMMRQPENILGGVPKDSLGKINIIKYDGSFKIIIYPLK